MDHSGSDRHFKQSAMMVGIHHGFQVMPLESMNMSDPDGNTHLIMVNLTRGEKAMK